MDSEDSGEVQKRAQAGSHITLVDRQADGRERKSIWWASDDDSDVCVESIAFGYNMAGQGTVHEHSFQTQLQKAVHGCMNGTCSQWEGFSGSGVQRLIGTRDINKELKLFYETQMVTSIESITEDKDK